MSQKSQFTKHIIRFDQMIVAESVSIAWGLIGKCIQKLLPTQGTTSDEIDPRGTTTKSNDKAQEIGAPASGFGVKVEKSVKMFIVDRMPCVITNAASGLESGCEHGNLSTSNF